MGDASAKNDNSGMKALHMEKQRTPGSPECLAGMY
ncbi:Glyceraldehyde-3-phosphate dehydrogenase [Giardia duodenalis]|uniref:Glyceraldehyde-3-phosphate dehydrogenase n=1 Tax=Giardia intestinalis TaxID=5741 RepID=V6TTR5_GIAIN|nr:Glyceraldehyde-3-phosphate dehydrogenase [Giardia intestinalis]